MSFFQKRIKATKEELAEVLGNWIETQLTEEQIRQTAIYFDINTNNQEELSSLVNELFNLNMWIVVINCEKVFKNKSKRDDCYQDIAISKKDPTICDEIESVGKRENCYGSV